MNINLKYITDYNQSNCKTSLIDNSISFKQLSINSLKPLLQLLTIKVLSTLQCIDYETRYVFQITIDSEYLMDKLYDRCKTITLFIMSV